MKTAICQVADTGPLESLVIMLRSAGYSCFLPDRGLRTKLRSIGCDNVLEISGLVNGWGYENPFSLPEASTSMMGSIDLFVDIKAHRNGPKIRKEWPNLSEKILWYRINGCAPEHVIRDGEDMGDEVNPGCPVLTPNRWYEGLPSSYSCWPPFHRFDEYFAKHFRPSDGWYTNPVCLIHNLAGWGYGALVEPLQKMGVSFFGAGSPNGLVKHQNIPIMLSNALCMVHLKSSDSPGYALYEAMAAGCPLVVPRRLIWRSKMQELLVPGETCLVFDRETHDALSEQDVQDCLAEIRDNLSILSNPNDNRRIGLAGMERLSDIMWNSTDGSDSLQKFMSENFK